MADGNSSNAKPAPQPEDLKKSMEQMPEGPNVEFSPYEVQAARGETPLEGPRAEDEAGDGQAGDGAPGEKSGHPDPSARRPDRPTP